MSQRQVLDRNNRKKRWERVCSLSNSCQGHVWFVRFWNGWGQASTWWLDQKSNSESECRVSIYRQHYKAGQLGCFDKFSQWQKRLLNMWDQKQINLGLYLYTSDSLTPSHSWSSSIFTVYWIIVYVYARSLSFCAGAGQSSWNVAWSQLEFEVHV